MIETLSLFVALGLIGFLVFLVFRAGKALLNFLLEWPFKQ